LIPENGKKRMTSKPKTPVRRVKSRKWVAATAASLALVQPALTSAFLPSAALAAGASEAGEGGEAGEAGVALSEGPALFLTELGYFEGTYRIAATLYLGGARDLARAHLEESHHAFYEDIAPQLQNLGATGFETEATAFTGAIAADTSDAEVRATFENLIAALGRSTEAAQASLHDELMSLHDLMALAVAEYEGGVDDGKVELAIEYRDSWGFYATVKARASAMAESNDPAVAQAGRDVLEQLEGIDALYPALTSGVASNDPSLLAVASGWIEIIALRNK